MNSAVPCEVEARDVIVRYGQVEAVNGLNLTVAAGEVLGLLGGNGAGKSSTLRAFAGVNPPTSGYLNVAGYDLANPRQAEQARWVVGYCPDVGGLVRQATVREHIAVALASRNMADAWPQALEMLDLFGLADVLDRETHGFSHGMSRRLSVMLAAVTSSRVLILDEPFDGVDPLGVHATEHVIQQAREAGVAVIVSTHLLPLLAGVSDRIAVMVRGKVKETGPAGGYLGLTGAAHYEEILNGTADEDAPVPAGRP